MPGLYLFPRAGLWYLPRKCLLNECLAFEKSKWWSERKNKFPSEFRSPSSASCRLMLSTWILHKSPFWYQGNRTPGDGHTQRPAREIFKSKVLSDRYQWQGLHWSVGWLSSRHASCTDQHRGAGTKMSSSYDANWLKRVHAIQAPVESEIECHWTYKSRESFDFCH